MSRTEGATRSERPINSGVVNVVNYGNIDVYPEVYMNRHKKTHTTCDKNSAQTTTANARVQASMDSSINAVATKIKTN